MEPRDDDDKGWWRELVELNTSIRHRALYRAISIATTFSKSPMNISPKPECGRFIRKYVDVLTRLRVRDFSSTVVSNFDGRLRSILRASRYLEILLAHIRFE